MKKESVYQINSLWTLKAYFKDGNTFAGHSWRQEIKTKARIIDQRQAYTRLINLAQNCTCSKSISCFHCNHTTILIFCNLTEECVYKMSHKYIKTMAAVHFTELSIKGSTHIILSRINNTNMFEAAKEHARANWIFNKMNR